MCGQRSSRAKASPSLQKTQIGCEPALPVRQPRAWSSLTVPTATRSSMAAGYREERGGGPGWIWRMRIFAVSGSLQAGSSNTRFVEAARDLAPDGVEVDVFES